MKKCIILLIVGFIPLFFWTQNFSLIGPRLQQFSWDLPSCIGINEDNDGNILILVREAQQPRNPEVVKMNMTSLEWEDLTMNTLPTEAFSTGEGIVKPDGTIYLGMRAFDNMYYAYIINQDIDLSPLSGTDGVVPNNNPNGGLDTAVEMDANGAFYIAGGMEGSFLSKFENGEWTFLPKFQNASYESPLIQFPDLAFDDEGNLYIAFQEKQEEVEGAPWSVKLKKLTPNAEQWETLIEETLPNETPAVLAVSPNEVYFSYFQQFDDFNFYFVVKKYDGASISQVGNPIPVTEYGLCAQADMIKLSSNGKLYISNCEDIYEYNEMTNQWVALDNDIEDGSFVASFDDKFYEMSDGTLINVVADLDPSFSYEEFALVRYTPDDLNTTEIENFELSSYPNPTTDQFTVSLKNQTIKKIELFSLSGELLESFTPAHTSSYQMSLAKYAEGTYLVRINGGKTLKVIRSNSMRK